MSWSDFYHRLGKRYIVGTRRDFYVFDYQVRAGTLKRVDGKYVFEPEPGAELGEVFMSELEDFTLEEDRFMEKIEKFEKS